MDDINILKEELDQFLIDYKKLCEKHNVYIHFDETCTVRCLDNFLDENCHEDLLNTLKKSPCVDV